MRVEQLKQPRIDASTVRVPGVAPRWVLPTVQAALMLTDALVALGAFLLAYHLRQRNAPGSARERSRFEFIAHAPYAQVFPLFGADKERVWAGKEWDPTFIYPKPAIDVEGVKTVLALRSEYGEPRKALTDPARYYDLSYYAQALK